MCSKPLFAFIDFYEDTVMEVSLLVSTINKILPEPHASLLSGMLFGVKTSMPDEFYKSLITTGMLHVIALSGTNISIIVRLMFDGFGTFLGKTAGVLITILAILWFIFLVGPTPTIVRAGIMGTISVSAVLFGRRDIPLISLFCTVMAMALISPSLITNVSFQLSVGATLGIIVFGGNEEVLRANMSLFGRAYDFLKRELRVTLAAQVFTVPIIFYYFHRISLISPVANVAVGFLVGPITILGLVMVTAGLVWFPLGIMMSYLVWPLLEIFIVVINILAKVPVASLTI